MTEENIGLAAHVPIDVADVVVRELRHADAEAYVRGTEDPAVRAYAHLPLAEYTAEIVHQQIDGVIADGLSQGSLAVLAIADRTSDQFLGSIVLFNLRSDRAEVGFWLAKEARGRGAAVKALEAAATLVARMGLVALDARTSPENVASRRVLEAAGFEQKGDVQDQETPSGAVVPVLTYERSPCSDFHV